MTRNEMIVVLMAYGHSAFKATEIAIDIERGDGYATKWFAAVAASVATRALPPPGHQP